jgi:hypothetical protein
VTSPFGKVLLLGTRKAPACAADPKVPHASGGRRGILSEWRRNGAKILPPFHKEGRNCAK